LALISILGLLSSVRIAHIACIMAAGSRYIASTRTTQRTPLPTALLLLLACHFYGDYLAMAVVYRAIT
jgi:hypothetical protein